MLNKKGFTLVELLAMMIVLGIIMATIIPNIVGISNSNRLQTYAEDAKKFKSIVEYKMRSDNTYFRPNISSHCGVFTLGNIAGSEFDKGPYGGEYSTEASYVVVSKESDEYKYYVQLVEKITENSYRGFALRPIESIEGKNYLNDYQDYNGNDHSTLWYDETLPNEMKITFNPSSRLVEDSDQKYYLLSRTPCMMAVVDMTV